MYIKLSGFFEKKMLLHLGTQLYARTETSDKLIEARQVEQAVSVLATATQHSLPRASKVYLWIAS